MKQPKNDGGDARWDRGWQAHKASQLRRLARLPFAEKLRWLEEAQEFGEKLILQANRGKRTQQ